MAETNYEKLQHCSNQISKLINLEKKYREAKIIVEDEEIDFSPQTITRLKQKFVVIRADLIDVLNSLTGD